MTSCVQGLASHYHKSYRAALPLIAQTRLHKSDRLYPNGKRCAKGIAKLKSMNKFRPLQLKPRSERIAANSTGERRRTVRIPYHTSVKCFTTDGPVSGVIRDLSAKALFVDIRKPFSVGQKFELDFTLRSGRHSMKLQAEVVRQARQGMAIRLLS